MELQLNFHRTFRYHFFLSKEFLDIQVIAECKSAISVHETIKTDSHLTLFSYNMKYGCPSMSFDAKSWTLHCVMVCYSYLNQTKPKANLAAHALYQFSIRENHLISETDRQRQRQRQRVPMFVATKIHHGFYKAIWGTARNVNNTYLIKSLLRQLAW